MISLLGIVIGLALFILLAYMGYNTIIVAIASAMVVAVFGGMNPFVALSIPRVSGGEPHISGFHKNAPMYSPRERG